MLTSTFLRKNRHSDQIKNEGGFIILTVPIVLILFAFFVASITKDTKPNQFYAAVTTQQKLENVRTALANYAHQNYRVPCPSNPTLAKTNALFGAETPLDANNKCANTRGIIPFKTLGISEDLAKDAWGFYLTYKVSPDFTTQLASTNSAQFTEAGNGIEKLIVPVNSGENHLHEMCRTANWTNTTGTYRNSSGASQTKSGATNENIFKARFCCASNTSGGGGHSIKAADQQSVIQNAIRNGTGGAIDLVDEHGTSTGIVLSSAVADNNFYWDFKPAWYQREKYATYAGSDLHYDNDHHGLGDGLGLDASPWDSYGFGKFYPIAATFDIINPNLNVRKIDLAMSDVGESNEGEPVQVAIEVVKIVNGVKHPIEGSPFSFVLALPEGPDAFKTPGIGSMVVDLDYFNTATPNPYQGNLYTQNPLHYAEDHKPRETEKRAAAPAGAMALFADTHKRLHESLNDAGLTLDDVSIGHLKVNATHASMSFSAMEFGTAGTPSNTDLIIMDENDDPDNPRLAPRDNQAAYGSADQTHTATIDPSYEAAAYAVISHGSDGVGSYMIGTPNQFSATGPDNPWEIANASTNDSVLQIYDVRQISSSDPLENFDDIVVWDSQISLYKALRNGTCTSSQAL